MVVLMNMATGEREILNETPERAPLDVGLDVGLFPMPRLATRADFPSSSASLPPCLFDESVDDFLARMECWPAS